MSPRLMRLPTNFPLLLLNPAMYLHSLPHVPTDNRNNRTIMSGEEWMTICSSRWTGWGIWEMTSWIQRLQKEWGLRSLRNDQLNSKTSERISDRLEESAESTIQSSENGKISAWWRRLVLETLGLCPKISHNIIQIHNNVLWDWQCFMEYSPYLGNKNSRILQ